MSRGRLNIATCLVSGSIETDDQRVGVERLSPGRWSAPMSRMLRRSLPSHGGIDTFGTALPTGVLSGTGESVASEPSLPSSLGGRGRDGGCRASARRRRSHSLVVADEDAAAVEDVLGEHVVARDDDVAAGHDQHDREQAGDGQRVARRCAAGRAGRRRTRPRR